MTGGPVDRPAAAEPVDELDAPEPCGACTSWRVVEPGTGADVSTAEILVCRRAEANMCPAMLAGEHDERDDLQAEVERLRAENARLSSAVRSYGLGLLNLVGGA